MCSVLRALLVIITAAVIGLSVNALRGQGRIDLSRQYFRTSEREGTGRGDGPRPEHRPGGAPEGHGEADVGGTDAPSASQSGGVPGDASDSNDSVAGEFHPVDTTRARELYQQSLELPGFVIFLDARPADEYRAGHVPAAYPLDYYNITNLSQEELGAVLEAIEVAHEVVVYCNGGDCEDSLLLCGELRDSYFVPVDKLHLFAGGMESWRKAELPVEKGDRQDPGDGE